MICYAANIFTRDKNEIGETVRLFVENDYNHIPIKYILQQYRCLKKIKFSS